MFGSSDARSMDEKDPPDPNDEELIIIRPSTELIPDEYEHTNNQDVAVHIFKSSSIKSKNSETQFVTTMEDLGYNIPKENLHPLDEYADIIKSIDNIARGCQGKSMLILLFIGYFDDDQHKNIFKLSLTESIEFKEIWSRFTTEKCLELRNKPKLFLFQIQKFRSSLHTDHILRYSQKVFEMPVESDMLIVYNKIVSRESTFIETFCENVKHYGQMEDIISLVTYTHVPHEFQPIIISTLTRKMYLTESTVRGHHLEIAEFHKTLEMKFKNAEALLKTLQEEMKKPSGGAIQRIRSFLSPRTSRQSTPDNSRPSSIDGAVAGPSRTTGRPSGARQTRPSTTDKTVKPSPTPPSSISRARRPQNTSNGDLSAPSTSSRTRGMIPNLSNSDLNSQTASSSSSRTRGMPHNTSNSDLHSQTPPSSISRARRPSYNTINSATNSQTQPSTSPRTRAPPQSIADKPAWIP